MNTQNTGESSEEILSRLRSKAAALPRSPGVYIMENKGGTVIYVGKSRSLRDRVSQYFHGSHAIKTARMVANVYDFRFITCDTEMEALALENNLIKQYNPRYNIKLKDAKSYPYIKLTTNKPYPRLDMTRTRLNDGAMYFGPYSGTATVYSVISTLERTLGIPGCKRRFPRDIGKERPCVYKQIGRCVGVCAGDITREEYLDIIRCAADILRGNTADAISKFEDRMTVCAEDMRYEEAARCRDAIEGLRKLGERQKTVGAPDFECDVIAVSSEDDFDCAAVLFIRSGYITDSDYFVFGSDEIVSQADSGDIVSDGESEVVAGDNADSPLTSFVIGLYHGREYIPGDVLLSFPLPEKDIALISEYLSARAGKKVRVRTPVRGEARRLCNMAVGDARRHGENRRKRENEDIRVLVTLASMLHLETVPERIEAYDISNLGSEYITAGMIVAENAKFKKSDYRYFRIKSQNGPDDYASMREAIIRRLSHIDDESGSYSKVPDLILLDGGKGHVSVIRETLRELGFDIPVFGMVKDEHHKTRTVVSDTDEISIAKSQEVFRFVYKLQEEVHRFTVSRMDAAKRKTLKHSSLEKINGIGPTKAKALMRHFGTVAKLKSSGVNEIAAVKGISLKDAENIRSFFDGNDNRI